MAVGFPSRSSIIPPAASGWRGRWIYAREAQKLLEFEDLILFGINFGWNAQLVKQQALALM